ncbi:MAG: lipid-binding protein [Cyclobacteriaceae bacterium]|nr:lipid-binding protein [Cyclobacteriaceae bacterium]
MKKDQDSVLVYTCHQPESKIKSIKASLTVRASLSELTARVMDVKSYTTWQYRIIKSEVLKNINERELIFHSEVSAPWPVSNRDMVAHLTVEQDKSTKAVTITIEGVPDFIPPVNKDVVRVQQSLGRWVVTPLQNGVLKVEYTFVIDPGGSIPSWLVNMAAAEGPSYTFRQFREIMHMNATRKKAAFIVD